MRRAGAPLFIAALVMSLATMAVAGQQVDLPDGSIEGREHEVRVRSVLGEVPPEAAKLTRAERVAGDAAVASCDPTQVAALRRKVPTTTRAGDDPAACVVVPTSQKEDADRLLLGPAHLTGSELGPVTLRQVRRGRHQVVVQLSTRGESRWAFLGAQLGATELAFTLDGEVVDLAPVAEDEETILGGLSVILGDGKAFPSGRAERTLDLIEQAEHEEVIELARQASLSRRGRELFALTEPVIREKTDFTRGCPLPEADDTFVLGCYDPSTNDISILRVDRADVAAAMPVTAAHEMLHAVYEELGSKERTKVDAMLEELLAASPQPRIEESLALYTDAERANELHALLGTEVRDLPRPVERYYEHYFDDRAAVVTLFEGYQAVFDALEARFEQLEAELAQLDAQLRDIEAQANAAASESDGLFNRIEELRNQGRIDESNNLVGAQNAAADRANALAGQYNALVEQYNAKVAEANATALSLDDLYTEVSPVEAPAG